MKDQIFTVTRAVMDDPQATLMKLIIAEAERPEIDEVISRIQCGKCDYSGIFFKNFFRVNHPIKLVDLGFYGPYDELEADYTAHVQIYKPTKAKTLFPDSNSFRVANARCRVTARNQGLFHVGFVDSVYIQPHVWHLIEFRLDGPPTWRSTDTLDSATVPVHVSDSQQKDIHFQFRPGSKQMPCLRFKVA